MEADATPPQIPEELLAEFEALQKRTREIVDTGVGEESVDPLDPEVAEVQNSTHQRVDSLELPGFRVQ